MDRRVKISTDPLRCHVAGRSVVKGSDQTDDCAKCVLFLELAIAVEDAQASHRPAQTAPSEVCRCRTLKLPFGNAEKPHFWYNSNYFDLCREMDPLHRMALHNCSECYLVGRASTGDARFAGGATSPSSWSPFTTKHRFRSGHDVVSIDFGLLGNTSVGEKTAPYLCMVDHVSGAMFAVLTSKAASDCVIKGMVASAAKYIILKRDAEPSCKSISGTMQKRADDLAEHFLLEAMAATEWSSA